MTLSIFIPTVEGRLPMAEALQKQFEGYGFSAKLALDQEHNSVKNHNKAWCLGSVTGMDWTCVVQDDVELCPDFGNRFAVALGEFENMGDGVLSLYSNYGADLIALQKGEHFRKHMGSRFLNEQFLCMRWSVVVLYMAYFTRLDLSVYKTGWHDVILAQFFKEYGRSVYHAIPNLVDHRPVKSVLGHGGRNRRSRTFGMDAQQPVKAGELNE